MAAQTHDNSDYSVTDKAGVRLGHSPSGLLLPGIDATTRLEAARLCARDLLEHHAFFNSRGFHNHLTHHLLSVFSMGAPAGRLQTIFDQNKGMQRSLAEHSGDVVITAENYADHLADELCYGSYIQFFRRELDAAGDQWPARALDYFFDPRVFPHAIDGVFHPLIQVGYGLEFDSSAITAMGLAGACVQGRVLNKMFEPDSFAEICAATPAQDGRGLSVMQIFDMARNDPLAAKIAFTERPFIYTRTDVVEDLAAKCAKEWAVPATNEAVAAKYAELLSAAALFYGSCTRPGYRTLLHFIVMHCLTSAYFLPVFFDRLPVERQAALLKAHLGVMLSVFVMLGSPEFHVRPELTSPDTHGAGSGNAWLGVFERAIASDDIHIPKVVRALWRGSLLGAFPGPVDGDGEYELPPAINWLHLAHISLDTITASTFADLEAQAKEGKRFWTFGMIGCDEFWAKYPKE